MYIMYVTCMYIYIYIHIHIYVYIYIYIYIHIYIYIYIYWLSYANMICPHPRSPAARLSFVLLCLSVFSSPWGNPEVGGGVTFGVPTGRDDALRVRLKIPHPAPCASNVFAQLLVSCLAGLFCTTIYWAAAPNFVSQLVVCLLVSNLSSLLA